MLEYAVYTVATPEACAAILWKNSKESLAAAEALKITSHDFKFPPEFQHGHALEIIANTKLVKWTTSIST